MSSWLQLVLQYGDTGERKKNTIVCRSTKKWKEQVSLSADQTKKKKLNDLWMFVSDNIIPNIIILSNLNKYCLSIY